jgi:hypothetical protein
MMKKDLVTINNKVIKITNRIGILDKISWPAHLEQIFLEGIKKGNKPVLKFCYEKFDLSESKKKIIFINREPTTYLYITLN